MSIKRFPVEEGSILQFARAVGDPNPIYSDVEHASRSEFGTVIAPPTYVQASAHFDPDWPLRPREGEPWFGSGKTSSGGPAPGAETGGTELHAEQTFHYHRQLKAGDVLTGETRPGKSWEKQGKSGKLVFAELITEFWDQTGELVVTVVGLGVRTERPVGSEG